MANALPLLLAVGAGAVLLSKKKKPAKKAKKNGAPKNNVVASGSVERTSIPKVGESSLNYEWQVRKSNGTYVAEAGRPETLRDPDVKMWKAIGEADTVQDAKELALAWIGEQPGYESDVEIVDSGAKGEWEWRVITDPERGFIGQYLIPGKQWLNAVEGPEYNEQFKYAVWEVAIKDWERQQASAP